MEQIVYLSQRLGAVKNVVSIVSCDALEGAKLELELYRCELELEKLKTMEVTANRIARLVEVLSDRKFS